MKHNRIKFDETISEQLAHAWEQLWYHERFGFTIGTAFGALVVMVITIILVILI